MKRLSHHTEMLDSLLGSVLSAARVPGAAIAVVVGQEVIYANGLGYRDLAKRLPMKAQTVYPVGSTTKAMNAVLLGILVDDGMLEWDRPVQDYLPGFRLRDECASSRVTLRDLLVMRTGLPRHDWSWSENTTTRAELVARLRYLEPSAGFRERFQYNNLTATVAGHIAEVVTGRKWEELMRRRLLGPLGMRSTGFVFPGAVAGTLSYHENNDRLIMPTRRSDTRVAAPAGGVIHSTVVDMARWVSFNLENGKAGREQLITPTTLAEIHSPQVAAGSDATAPTLDAAYAMGWFVDAYNGHPRLVHGGYIHDVHSVVTLFPKDKIGIVAFTNFGAPIPARLLSEHAFDLLLGLKPVQTIQNQLAQYEQKIAETRALNGSARRVMGTAPSHSLAEYIGTYAHPGYGEFSIRRQREQLILQRHQLTVLLSHWHYDAWVAKNTDMSPIDAPQAFSPVYPLLFETSADGTVAAATIRLELKAAPIRFEKRSVTRL